jgi:hypothetical protein
MANPNTLRYPLDTTEYKARVIFKIKEDVTTGSATRSALETLINQNNEEIKKLEEQKNELVSEFRAEDITQAQFDEKLKALTDEYNRLKGEIATFKGLTNQPAKKETTSVEREVIDLYLPIGLQFRDNVTYENFDLGSIGAGMEAGLGFAESMTKGVGSIIRGVMGGAATENVARLAGVQLASKFGSFSAEAAAVQKLAGGVTLNPNTRVLFKQPNIRDFTFTFKFVAKSAKESEVVQNIIKTFRRELYPSSIDVPLGDATISLGYVFPKKFNIEFQYGGNPIPGLAKIKPCYLRDVSTTYNSSQMGMHSDGNFLEIDMTLSFQETSALTRADIEGGF